jgi:hypothetical protein
MIKRLLILKYTRKYPSRNQLLRLFLVFRNSIADDSSSKSNSDIWVFSDLFSNSSEVVEDVEVYWNDSKWKSREVASKSDDKEKGNEELKI